MANIMELMREYKHLKQLKKKTGKLGDAEEARLREVGVYLQGTLAGRDKKGQKKTAAPPAAPTPPNPAAPPPPQPAAPKPANPASTDAEKAHWQQQAEADRQRQAKAQSNFQVALPDEIASYEPPEASAVGDGELPADPPKARMKPRTQEDLEQQLRDIQSESLFTTDYFELQSDYYYSYVDEGYSPVQEPVDLEPIDPRESELRAAGLLSTTDSPEAGAVTITKVPGGVFLDDFMVLYEKGILPRPEEEVEPDIEDPNALIPGKRKVTIHMLNGEVKRGTIEKIMRGDLGFTLKPQRGRREEIAFTHVKALFIMGTQNPDATAGNKVVVEFKDRRRIQGTSPDYEPGVPIFTLFPVGRGNFERVIVNTAAAARIG